MLARVYICPVWLYMSQILSRKWNKNLKKKIIKKKKKKKNMAY